MTLFWPISQVGDGRWLRGGERIFWEGFLLFLGGGMGTKYFDFFLGGGL